MKKIVKCQPQTKTLKTTSNGVKTGARQDEKVERSFMKNHLKKAQMRRGESFLLLSFPALYFESNLLSFFLYEAMLYGISAKMSRKYEE